MPEPLDLYKRLVAVAEEFGFVSDDVKDMLEEAAGMVVDDPRSGEGG